MIDYTYYDAETNNNLIDRVAFIQSLPNGISAIELVEKLLSFPATDAVSIVRCKDCVNHNKCSVETTFIFARIENPYCCVGKMQTNKEREE